MKIISLGKIDVKFECPNCGTVFEVSTNEFVHDESAHSYNVRCPLCGRPIWLGSGVFADKIFREDINSLYLSNRARKCLRRLKVNTVNELTALTESDLRRTKGLGAKTLKEIRMMLCQNGLKLKEED